MPSLHPLQLPEILSHVAQYIPAYSLPTCSLVSKAWHHAFNPFIWRTISLDNSRPHPLDAIQHHGHLVKTLNIACTVTQEHTALQLPNLVSLEVSPEQDVDITALFTEHQHLTHLRLAKCNPRTTLWDKLLGLRSLKSLSMSHMVIDVDDIDSFWHLCTHLEQLHLDYVSILHQGNLSSINFPHLKKIQLSSIREEDISISLGLMRRCPGLKEVYWNNWESRLDAQFVAGFIQLLAAGIWPNLDSVCLGTIETTIEELSRIIESMRKVVVLNIGGSPDLFGPISMDQLRPHFPHLRELRLQSAKRVTSLMAQKILSSCPLLRKLTVPEIEAIDVVEGEPWVCLGIQELSVCFYFDPSTIEFAQPLVVDQLSRLTRLEELHLNWTQTPSHPSVPLFGEAFDLRLENDLGKLSSLRRLHAISFINTKQKMGKQEINWILEHWRCLEVLYGVLDDWNPKIENALKGRLRKHGIVVGPDLYDSYNFHQFSDDDLEDEGVASSD